VHERETAVALANIGALAHGPVLLVDLWGPALPAALAERGVPATSFHTDLRGARSTPGSVFGPWLDDGSYQTILVALPAAAGRLRMLLRLTRARLVPGGTIYVVGANDSGIRSAARHLADLVGEPAVVDARRHCRLLRASRAEPVPAALDEERSTFTAVLAGEPATVTSFPGLFAHGRLDPGTGLLLDTIERVGEARVLDVGCGSGALSLGLARMGASVTAVDSDALAIEATRATLGIQARRATLAPDATVIASDVYSDVEGPFDLIASNPPFHLGARTHHRVTERIVAGAPQRLARGGTLWLVTNRHLPTGRLLGETFASVTSAAQTDRYRVWRAR